MDRREISDRIKAHIRERFPRDDAEIEDSTDLLHDWFMDSLAIIEMVAFLEESFDIRLTRADVNGTVFKDVISLAELVASRLPGGG